MPQLAANLREAVALRAGQCCEYCQILTEFSPAPFEVDHVLPKSSGGSDDLSNLAYSCGGCNGNKNERTHWADPVDGQLSPYFNPRQQTWAEHFAWNADATEIIGLTSSGRATVEGLNLNRIGLRNLRRLLVLDGRHPPTE